MQKWNQVDLLVLKAFAPTDEPLSIIRCITETFDLLRRVMHWQVFERECRKTLVYRIMIVPGAWYTPTSVDTAERRRCNKALGTTELLPPKPWSE